jgi:hypothetical protein
MLVEDERTERAAAFKQLESSLRALAMSASDQLTLFPEDVVTADELALRFDHAWSAVRATYGHELSASQIAALDSVERELDAMSRDGAAFDLDLWTESALRSSEQWAAVRRLAVDALATFGDDWVAG